MNSEKAGLMAGQPAFKKQSQTDPMTGKTLATYRHNCGLIVKVLPRPGFSRRFAAVTVPYGSIHTSFETNGRINIVPAGTAHFLEHCIFSRDDDGGLLGKLSGLGATANAYTSHTHTMYYFSTVHHFEQALGQYLEAILNPYLETDRIEAERPVILAELDQYQDDPDSRCFNGLLECLYARHPVREDIGGTAESVSSITSDDLKTVWRSFYQPESIVLTLAGDFDLDMLLGQLDDFLRRGSLSRPLPQRAGRLILPEEPEWPAAPGRILRMDVKTPTFLVGIKDPSILPGREQVGRMLAMRQRAARLYLDTLLSPVSELHDQLYGAGLINDSFDFHYSCEESYAYLICGGESTQPDKAAETLIEGLINHFAKPADPVLFEIQKRAAAGDFVRSLDSVDHSGMVEAQCSLNGIDLFDYPGIYDMIDFTTAREMMRFLSDRACYSVAVLMPTEVT